jgi:ABC-type phosphate transport system substrate-binding protein
MRFTVRGSAVVAVGAAILSLALGGTALADPNLNNNGSTRTTGFLPDADDFVCVGSDTSQYVINTAAQFYSEQAPPNTPTRRVASFNAIKPGTESAPVTHDLIQIRPGITIARPNGSSEGITTVLNNTNVDCARSSRASRGGTENTLSFVKTLTDGLSYIIAKTATAPIRNLDATALGAVYKCTDTRGFHPKLPQTGSGTRAFFLAQIGVTDAQVGACVDQTVQEHDPSSVVNDPVALAPFSTGRWSVNPVSPSSPPSAVVDIAATAPTAGVFYTERNIYNVVRANVFNNADVQAVFGPSGFFCNRYATNGASRQGFKVNASCGVADPPV